MTAEASDLPIARSITQRLSMRKFLLDLLAFALVLIAPWFVLLGYHGYTLLAPEVLLVAMAAVAIAVILALASGLMGALGRTVLFALLLTLFIDLHVTLPPSLSSILVVVLYLGVAAALGVLLWLLREHASAIVSVIFVTLIAFTLLTTDPSFQRITNRAGTAAAHASNAPLLIHLVLDEHIGVEGLPPEIDAARRLRGELLEFYTSRGFRLFGGAYSQYANTENAIANLLNFAERGFNHSFVRRGTGGREWELSDSAYFSMLQQRGYQLHLYQSTYIDLCHANGVRLRNCLTYPVASLESLQDLPLQAREKARFIVVALLSRSRSLLVLNRAYERLVRQPLARRGVDVPSRRLEPPSFGSLPVPAVLEQLTADIVAHPRGHAFFAHLMVPHYPYVFDDRCEMRPRAADWLTNHLTPSDSFVYNTAESRAQRYELYTDQVRCVLSMLDDLLDTLESRGLLEGATVVVNGDHGSRIAAHFPNGINLRGGVLTDTDYRDTFSTLYAIKAPGVQPGYVQRPAPLVSLLDHYLGGEPLSEQNSCRVFLISGDARSVLTKVEPRFCAREENAASEGDHN
jgi:hypothetical protein